MPLSALHILPEDDPQSAIEVLQELLSALMWARTLFDVNMAAAEATEQLSKLMG